MSTQNNKTRAAMKRATKQEGQAVIAAAIGYNKGTLSNMISGQAPYEPAGKTPNIVDNCINLIHACENEILLHYICQHFGFMAIKNPVIGSVDLSAIMQLTKMMHGFAQFFEEITAANEDGKITGSEAEDIRHRWEPLKKGIEEFVISAEHGAYAK